MKITKIIIPEYRQFKNFELDLTYPEGHAKAGQPLEKVCFIGQSGTGKTTLLELLHSFMLATEITRSSHNELPKFDIEDKFQIESNFVKMIKKEDNETPEMWFLHENEDWFDYRDFKFGESNAKASITPAKLMLVKEYENHKYDKKSVYLTADIQAPFSQLQKKQKEGKNIIGAEENLQNVRQERYANSCIKIDEQVDEKLWQYIFQDIALYDKKLLSKAQEFILRMTQSNGEDTMKEFSEWKNQLNNPRKKYVELLNPILSNFNVIFSEEDTANYLSLRNKTSKKHIPHSGLSTGTKQIILTAILLDSFAKSLMMLLDEPERSLFPNIQQEIVEFYTKIAPTSQFFFATHSPIIAASFEPWEIVELYFDKNGEVQPRKYYEGKRHFDTYFLDFRYLRWDDILMKGFGMGEEGNSEFREKELMKTARLHKRLIKMRAEGKVQTPEYQASLSEYLASAKKVGWNHEKD